MEDRQLNQNHRMQFANRKQGSITGVIDVMSFDLTDIVLETQMGMLTIKGNDLHVKRLTLEKGEIDIEGEIDSLVYSNLAKYKKSKQSMVGRLFK